MPAARVREVKSQRDFAAFVDVPYILRRGDPDWVAPLRGDQQKTLARSYPFFEHGDAALFIAEKAGKPAGRLTAHVNTAHLDKFRRDPAHAGRGFFGWFECIEDQMVADELFGAAIDWLLSRELGLTHVRGPLNWDINGECPGVLVEDHEPGPPVILMAHNPAYYAFLCEGAGFSKAMDLLAYIARRDADLPDKLEWLARMAGAARRRLDGMVIRELDTRGGYRADMGLVRTLFNSAWAANWGATDISEAEMKVIADGLKPIVKPALTRIAFIDGQPAGFIVCIPDVNQALHGLNGRLLPFGWLRLLSRLKRVNTFRTILMGVAEPFRGRGVDAVLIHEVMQTGDKLGYDAAELGWVLETNQAMNSIASKVGSPYRRYRVYEREL